MKIDGERLKRARVGRGLSQRALAAAAGVSVNTVLRLERGGGFSPATLGRVAKALGVEAAGLVDWDDPPTAPETEPEPACDKNTMPGGWRRNPMTGNWEIVG